MVDNIEQKTIDVSNTNELLDHIELLIKLSIQQIIIQPDTDLMQGLQIARLKTILDILPLVRNPVQEDYKSLITFNG